MGAVRDVSDDGIARFGVAGFVVDILKTGYEDEIVVVVDVQVLLWPKTRRWRKFEKDASARGLCGTSCCVPVWRISTTIFSEAAKGVYTL